MDRPRSQHFANLVQNEKATGRNVHHIVAFFCGYMDWGQIRPKGIRCAPCDKMCDGTREGTAEHNRRLKERKWEQDRKNRI